MQCGVERRSKVLRAQLVKSWWNTLRCSAPGAMILLALTSCEGKHRFYELPMPQDALLSRELPQRVPGRWHL